MPELSIRIHECKLCLNYKFEVSLTCLASIRIHECKLCLNYKFKVSLTCLGLIRVQLANACKRIEFEAIKICLVFVRISFLVLSCLEKLFRNVSYMFRIKLWLIYLLNKVLSIYG